MTNARRLWMKTTRGSSLGLLMGLALVVLTLACCGQNSNNSLKSENKSMGSNSGGGENAENSWPRAQNSQIVPDEVLVKFKPDTLPEIIESIRVEFQLETVRKFRSSNLFLMKITDGTPVETIIQKLKTYPDVEYAEPNYVVKANP
jgi:hypothetical protein